MEINKEILASGDISKIVKYLTDNNIEEKEIATAMGYKSKGDKANKANAVYKIRDGKSQPAWDKAYMLIQYLYTIDSSFSAEDIFKIKVENKERQNIIPDGNKIPLMREEMQIRSIKIEPQEQTIELQINKDEIFEMLAKNCEKEYEKKVLASLLQFYMEHKSRINEFIDIEHGKWLSAFENPPNCNKSKLIEDLDVNDIEKHKIQERTKIGFHLLLALLKPEIKITGKNKNGKKYTKEIINKRDDSQRKFCNEFEHIYAPERIAPKDVYITKPLIDD